MVIYIPRSDSDEASSFLAFLRAHTSPPRAIDGNRLTRDHARIMAP